MRDSSRTARIERACSIVGGMPVPAGTHGEWMALRFERNARSSGNKRIIFALPTGVKAWQLTMISAKTYRKLAVTVAKCDEELPAAIERLRRASHTRGPIPKDKKPLFV